jgi:DNA polymerase-3 subunit alpha
MAGGVDSFEEISRHQYFITDKDNLSFIDHLIRYGNLVKTQQTNTLFDDDTSYQKAQKKPNIPKGEEWAPLYRLNKEKELIGIYLSSHPLDDFKLEIKNFTNCTLAELQNLDNMKNRELSVAGLVTEVRHLTTKTGRPFGAFILEDYSDSYKFTLFGRDYEEMRKFMYEGYSLLIKGTVLQNTWRKDAEIWEFRIKSMVVLNNAREDIVQNLSLRVSLSDIDEELIREIYEETEKFPGKARVRFSIYDESEGIAVELFSRNKLVSVTNELVRFLDDHPLIDYRVS